MATWRYDSTTNWWPAAERRWCLCAISVTGTQLAARYHRGAVTMSQQRVKVMTLMTLYLTCSGRSSQWTLSCSSCVKPWSNFLVRGWSTPVVVTMHVMHGSGSRSVITSAIAAWSQLLHWDSIKYQTSLGKFIYLLGINNPSWTLVCLDFPLAISLGSEKG